MDTAVLPSLITVAGLLMMMERAGTPVILHLPFKGDIKRESQWLAQYGQAVCAVVVALVIWRLDTREALFRVPPAVLLLAGVGLTGLTATLMKRLLGRVRPGREHEGRFLGPSLRHASHRESFPSSHSACAVAMAVILSRLYPPAAVIFWSLALITAALRYLMEAHWPSDVLGGIALGYLIADWVWVVGS